MNEPERVVLVDESGRPIGTAEKPAVHHAETPLHLGFSCYLFDGEGAFLATRRARTKRVWPGVWTNSVCGHPAPGEAFEDAIRRRLRFELGMTAEALAVADPTYSYRAPPFRGIVEHELCPIYVGRAVDQPRPNPAEVEEFRWMSWEDFVRAAESDAADAYSWWCKDQLKRLKADPLIAEYSRPRAG
ncbi:MAG TPA: isopentenyl-diphosphate Delta-isomerase [Solirubrobacterales bacterium]|nr:isopentenyl-diphosphate Delta-isomerase [Solirubrobacterales bacterium]